MRPSCRWVWRLYSPKWLASNELGFVYVWKKERNNTRRQRMKIKCKLPVGYGSLIDPNG